MTFVRYLALDIIAGLVLACATSVVLAGALDPPGLKYGLDPRSPFLRELYESPVDGDFTSLMVSAEILNLAERHEDAARLKHIAERRLLKQLLGERADAYDSIEMAIKREERYAPDLAGLRRRVLDAVLVGPATESPPAPADAIAMGNSIRIVTEGEMVASFVRLVARNGTTEPVASFTYTVREARGQLFLACKPIGEEAIPAGAKRDVACTGSRERRPMVWPALEALRDGRLPERGAVDNLHLARSGIRLHGFGEHYDPSNRHAFLYEARRRITATDCRKLENCREVARDQMLGPAPYIPLERQTVSKRIPFLQTRYATPADRDDATLLTIADVLRFTDNVADGRLLEAIVQRRTLKRLLGEEYRLSGSVEAAIRAEAQEDEPIEQLRGRAMQTLVARYEPGSLATSSPAGRPSGTGSTTVTLRVKARNGIGDAVQNFSLRVDGKGDEPKYRLHLGCRSDRPIEPNQESVAACKGDIQEDRARPALERITADHTRSPWMVASVQLTKDQVLITPQFVRYQDKVTPYADLARKQIAAAGCQALGTCEREAALADAHREVRLLRRSAPLIFLAVVLFAGTIILLGARRVAAEHGQGSTAVSLFGGVVLLGCLVEIGIGLSVTLPGGQGMGGFVFAAFGIFYLAPPLALVALAHGATLLAKPTNRTWWNLFVFGVALATPLFWAVAFKLEPLTR